MDCSPPDSLSTGFSGKNTGVDCHVLLQGIFLNWKSNSHLPASLTLQVDCLPTEPPGKPYASSKLRTFGSFPVLAITDKITFIVKLVCLGLSFLSVGQGLVRCVKLSMLHVICQALSGTKSSGMCKARRIIIRARDYLAPLPYCRPPPPPLSRAGNLEQGAWRGGDLSKAIL